MCRGRWADLGTLALTEMATHGSAPYTTLQLLLVQLQIYLTTHHGFGGEFSWIHIEPGYTIFASFSWMFTADPGLILGDACTQLFSAISFNSGDGFRMTTHQ